MMYVKDSAEFIVCLLKIMDRGLEVDYFQKSFQNVWTTRHLNWYLNWDYKTEHCGYRAMPSFISS